MSFIFLPGNENTIFNYLTPYYQNFKSILTPNEGEY